MREFVAILRNLKALAKWRKRGWSDYAPNFVKEAVFKKYNIEGATWVETGTFLGKTTRFLATLAPKVYTIEPAEVYYKRAVETFSDGHVEPLNGTSEDVLPALLPKLSGNVCFWLDGHFSGGDTFKGSSDCPINAELEAIAGHCDRLGKLTILIDDVRCFPCNSNGLDDYPSLYTLVDWARERDYEWRIEQDIFVIRNWS